MVLIAVGQTRYAFTAQFLGGAFLLANRAADIESSPEPSELAQAEHRALVVGAIMQATAAIESELADVLQHGPGHYLGSNGIDHAALQFIAPMASFIDRTPGALDRWDLLLHVLKKPALEKGRNPYQDAELLVALRNELVHYHSQWDGKAAKGSGKWLETLKSKRFARPPFVPEGANFFPQKLLGAECVRWAAETAVAYLDEVCFKLGVQSVLDNHRLPNATFAEVLPPNRSAPK